MTNYIATSSAPITDGSVGALDWRYDDHLSSVNNVGNIIFNNSYNIHIKDCKREIVNIS